MRTLLLPLVLLALTLDPSPGLAQSSTDAASEGGITPPVSVVTTLVREALRAPDSPESWASLAQGLSAYGARGPGSHMPRGVMDAVRIADSLAFAPFAASNAGSQEEATTASKLVGAFVSLLNGVGGLLPLAAAVLVFLGLAASGWIPGLDPRSVRGVALRRKYSRSASRSSDTATPAGKPKADARSLALSLAEHGMPANEVARRTGMAQDEVAVVLALHRQQQGFLGDASLPRSA